MSVQSSVPQSGIQSRERGTPRGAVFLSYAREDIAAARRIAEALRASGIEVWFDETELRGGDSWDAKIRQQIRECALFVPIISAHTQGRREGYFRLEWRLADQRTHLMGKTGVFLLPVCIDETADANADVPDSFLVVQWTRLALSPSDGLPNGEALPGFCSRVRTLLEDRTAGSPVISKHGHDTRATPNTRAGRRRLVASAVGAAAVIAFFTIVRPWVPTASKQVAVPKRPDAVAPLTPAQQLVAKARQIFESGDELNHENYYLAEDLVKRAIGLDPAEPSAWALHAHLSFAMIYHSVDVSETRRDAMRRQAERAHTLAPDSTDAGIAVANARTMLRQDLAGVEHNLIALANREPENWRVQRSLGMVYRSLQRPEDALRAFRRARELADRSALTSADLANALLRFHRHEEAEAVIHEGLARQTSGRLLTFSQQVRAQWRGDLVGAARDLESWPDWLLGENRGAVLAWRTWLWARQHDKALAVAQRLPRDYLHDTFFTGPRAVLTARAHEGAGHTEAAREDWRTVVQLADRELASDSTDIAASFWKAWALARLGNTTGAQAICAQMEQRNQLARVSAALVTNYQSALYFSGPGAAMLWTIVGKPDLAVAELRAPALKEHYATTRAMLDYDPVFDSLRSDPRFAEIVARAPAPAEKSSLSGGAARPDQKSVAVLAFENLSGDKENEYFSDGISEELLNALSKVPGLRVAARTSAFYFKTHPVTLQEMGQKLGVAHLVDGTVRRLGNAVRVNAHLNRADTGEQIWMDQFEGELDKPWALQERIAGQIARVLEVKLGATARAGRSVNPEAYAFVLQGRHFWYQRTDKPEETLAKAIKAFQNALAIDSQFAEAHAGVADAWVVRGLYRSMDGRTDSVSEDYRQAKTEARRALELNPTLAEPYVTLGFACLNEQEFMQAEENFSRAFVLNPNYALAYAWHSLLLLAEGRLDAALGQIERSVRLDPLSSNSLWSLTNNNNNAGRFAEALKAADRAADLRPGLLPIHGERALTFLHLGRKNEAVEAARLVARDSTTDLRWWADADALYVLREVGLHDEATKWGERFLAKYAPGDYRRAFVLAGLGRMDEALGSIRTVPALGLARLYWNPMWDACREDPRFQQVLLKLGHAEEYKVARATLVQLRAENRRADDGGRTTDGHEKAGVK